METKTSPSEQKMALVEAFLSPQGEGYNAGRMAFFVRFAGCNLNCVFNDGSVCDTPWGHTNHKWSLDDLTGWMRDIMPGLDLMCDKPIVILTGGEPTMAPMFDTLVHHLNGLGFYVAVESNGTRFRDSMVTGVNWLVVSPKDEIDHAKPHQNPRPDSRTMALANEMRYVISGRNHPVPPINPHADAHFLSPALIADGTGMEWKDPNYHPTFVPGAVERCLEICQNDPRWRISIQTHKFLRVR